MSRKHALVIGNTEYDDPRLAQLSAPGKDAEDLARILGDREYCAFDSVRVLLNEIEPVVREAIDEFFDQKSPDDLLLLYFSGHGVRDELGALYLAVKNTNRARLRSTAVKSDFIHEAMEQSRSRRQVLILDCCNSGAFQRGTKAGTGGSIGIGNAFGGYGRVILTASDALQYALQGDAVMGSMQDSLFTHFLVQGLKGEADVNGDGIITVDELYDYAYEQVQNATPNQTPSKFSSKQEGDIVLRRITRLEEIKVASLPAPLLESLENPIAAIRLGAVEELARLLSNRNLGLVRAARQALERISDEDDSLRVRKAASDALAPVLAAEQQAREQAEQERLAREQAEAARLAEQKRQEELAAQLQRQAEEERLAREKAEAGRLAEQRRQEELAARQKAEAERLAQLKAQEELAARQKAEEERLARQRAEAKRSAEQKRQEELAARKKAQAAQPGVQPQWIAALWIALGCSMLAVLPDLIQGNYSFSRVLGGLAVAGVLYLQRIVKQWQSLLWIALGWAVGWGLDAAIISASHLSVGSGSPVRVATSALAGAIAGLAMVLAMRREKMVSRRDTMAWMTLAWAVAGAIDASIFQVIVQTEWHAGRYYYSTYALPDAIGAAIGAAIGGLAMIWLLRSANQTAQNLPLATIKQETKLQPKLRLPWLPALGIGLGYAAGAILQPILAPRPQIAPALFGAISGLVIAGVLYREHLLRQQNSILWIGLVWALASGIGSMIVAGIYNSTSIKLIESVSGALEGFIIAFLLYREGALRQRMSLLWITLVWAVAVLLTDWVTSVTHAMLRYYYWPVPDAIEAVLCGTLGGFAMLQLIQTESMQPDLPAALKALANRMPTSAATTQPNLRPRWIATLWFVLAFGSGIIFWLLHLDRPISDAVSGAFFGLVVACGLYLEHVLRKRLSLVWLALGSALAWIEEGVIFQAGGNVWLRVAVGAAIWGLALALVLRNEHALPDRISLLWMTAAWVIDQIIVEAIFQGPITTLAQRGINVMVVSDLNYALYGALGGLATIWLIRRAGEQNRGS